MYGEGQFVGLVKSCVFYIGFFILFRHFVPPSPKEKARKLVDFD